MLTATPFKSKSYIPKRQIRLKALLPWQETVKSQSGRFNVLCNGRRAGKTALGVDLLTNSLINEHKPVGWFSPTYKMLAEVWREMKYTLFPITSRISEQEHRIETFGGGVVEMWSLDNPNAVRGRKYQVVFIDEAAMVSKLEEAWTMVIRPTLADMRGRAWFASTPKGLNYFYSLWNMADNDKEWRRWRYPTEANPRIPPDEIEAMRRLPERVVLQEIDAKFVPDGAFFQGVEQAAVIEKHDKPEEHAGHYIVAGVDWALSEDYTVLTIGCRDCNKVIFWDRFNQLDFSYQRERIIRACKDYKVAGLLPERNNAQANIELLMQAGLNIARGTDGVNGFNTTSTTKPPLITKLAVALQNDGFKVPTDYADELRSYQVEVTTTNPKFSAPSGMHDDRVMSLALCWWAMTMYSRTGGIHV